MVDTSTVRPGQRGTATDLPTRNRVMIYDTVAV